MAERKEKNQQRLQPSRGRNEMTWRDPFAGFWNDPFGSLQRDWPSHRDWWPSRFFGRSAQGMPSWAPQIETLQRGDQFVVRRIFRA